MGSLRDLLGLMLRQNYSEAFMKSWPEEVALISSRCQELILKDYKIQILENLNGCLCGHYPPFLFFPSSGSNDSSELCSLIEQAKFARGRARFVFPSFTFNEKNVCRSSTLSNSLELYGRQVANVAGFAFDTSSGPLTNAELLSKQSDMIEDDRSTLNRVRDDDCKLMKRFGIRYICDFMLEYRKVKYWLPITSSEKAEGHDRYFDFMIIPMPYPGSEFFRIWRDSHYSMTGLMFDWNQPGIEVTLRPESIPKTLLSSNIDWRLYKSWDITELTKNYSRLLLGLLFEGAGGMLLHCVSGWDRTPLFISLMRCLLWADDLAHTSLGPAEMAYLTLAYDWFLFGHKLRTRFEIGEEIMRFAFCFLREAAPDAGLSLRAVYDMVIPSEMGSADVSSKSEDFVSLAAGLSPSLLQTREQRLRQLADLLLDVWDSTMESVRDIPRAYLPPGRKESSADDDDDDDISLSPGQLDNGKYLGALGSAVVSQISSAVSSAAAAVAGRWTKPPSPE